jgi:BirA family biotin operon repressor/biotin-[acetyl-CoA-carboxylase] ligase
LNWQIECLSEAPSTNAVARERLLAAWQRGASAEGIVITAARQSAGRGQHGRVWESPPGGLYMSVVVETVPVACRHKLALVAGAAVAGALGEACTFFEPDDAAALENLRIRWPNDLVLIEPGKPDVKVGGILCEAVAMGDRWAAIVGIGINVVIPAEAFSAALHGRATSLTAYDGQLRTVTGVLDAVLQHLEKGFVAIGRPDGWSQLLDYVRRHDALFGRQLLVDFQGQRFEGTSDGIDDAGGLRLQSAGKNIVMDVATLLAVDGSALRPAS